jgi:hypothetical protein
MLLRVKAALALPLLAVLLALAGCGATANDQSRYNDRDRTSNYGVGGGY